MENFVWRNRLELPKEEPSAKEIEEDCNELERIEAAAILSNRSRRSKLREASYAKRTALLVRSFQ